jgi:DNA-binding HxlR family transcriptional regulator
MQRTDFSQMACSIARTLHVIGEPWSPLILRDVLAGLARFDEIQADLGISRKVLAERLTWLVDNDVLRKERYSGHPSRFEYALTLKGRDLCDLLLVMTAWGDRWAAGSDGPPVLYRHATCGGLSHVELHCSHCKKPMRADEISFEDGPGSQAVARPTTGVDAAEHALP